MGRLEDIEPWRPAGWLVIVVVAVGSGSVAAELFLGGGRILTFGAGFLVGVAICTFAAWIDRFPRAAGSRKG